MEHTMPGDAAVLEPADAQIESAPDGASLASAGNAAKFENALLNALKDSGDITDAEASDVKAKSRSEKAKTQPREGGKFTSTAKTEKADTADSDEAESRHGDEAEPAPKLTEDEARTLMSALQRFRSPESVRKALLDGDDDTIAYARHMAKIQADTDEKMKVSKAAEEELKTLKAAQEKAKAEQAKQPPKVEPDPDIDALVKPFVEYFGEGTNESESVRRSFSTLLEGVNRKVAAQQEAHDTTLNALRDEVVGLREAAKDAHFQHACHVLKDEFPLLSDKDRRNAVRETMHDIAGRRDYDDFADIVRHAAEIEFAPDILREAKKIQGNQRKARSEGAMDLPAAKAADTVTMTRDQLITRALELRMEAPGGESDEAKELEKRARAMLQRSA